MNKPNKAKGQLTEAFGQADEAKHALATDATTPVGKPAETAYNPLNPAPSPDGGPKRALTVNVPYELHKAAKAKAAANGTTLTAVIVAALELYVKPSGN